MRNFRSQWFTLMMVVVVVVGVSVNAAPVKRCTNETECKQILKEIKQEALDLLEEKLEMQVNWILSGPIKCVPHFFCLAEKALLKNAKPKNSRLTKLHRHMIQYNKQTRDTHCEDTRDYPQCPIETFLGEVMMCVDYAINNKTSTKLDMKRNITHI